MLAATIHLIVLHLSIAMIAGAALADLLFCITKKESFRVVSFNGAVLAAITSAATVLSGYLVHAFIAYQGWWLAETARAHERFGLATLAVVVAAVIRIVIGRKKRLAGSWAHVYGYLIAAALVLAASACYYGMNVAGRQRSVTTQAAIGIAKDGIRGSISYYKWRAIEVELEDHRYVVTFPTRPLGPTEFGAEYAARVTVDARTGEVVDVLGGS